MVLLNTATKVYKGSTLATKVYRGAVQVWPPAPAWGPPQSVFTTQTPIEMAGLTDLTLGHDFQFAAAGRITGLRCYMSVNYTRPRTMKVWSTSGVLVATGVIPGQSAPDGWRSVTLGTPLAVSAGLTLRVSSYNSLLESVARNPTFTGPIVNAPITLLGPSAYFVTGDAYPATTNARLYFVDVIFEKAL